jgi:hypothetical protein
MSKTAAASAAPTLTIADMAAGATGAKTDKKIHTRPKMRFRNKFLLITFSLLMMGVLRTGFVFFVIGMLPAVVAYYMDISKYRYTFKTIFAANMAGMMPFITKILATGHSSTVLAEIMGNAFTWVIIYGSALVGWSLIVMCPMIAQIMVVGVNQTQYMRYDGLRKKLESEWGEEVKQFSNDPNAENNN